MPAGYDGPLDHASLQSMARKATGLEEDEPPSQEHEDNARQLNLRRIRPNNANDFIFSHNPMYCGTVALGLVVDTESAGLILSNYYTVVALVAYLYFEVRRGSLLGSQ